MGAMMAKQAKVKRLDIPIVKGKRKRVHMGSLAVEQKLHLKEMEQLDREIPLPSRETRGFVFGAFNK